MFPVAWCSLSSGVSHFLLTPSTHTLPLVPLTPEALGEGGEVGASSLPALTCPSVNSCSDHATESGQRRVCPVQRLPCSGCYPAQVFSMFVSSVHMQSFPKVQDSPPGLSLTKRFRLKEKKILHVVVSIVMGYKHILAELQLI